MNQNFTVLSAVQIHNKQIAPAPNCLHTKYKQDPTDGGRQTEGGAQGNN